MKIDIDKIREITEIDYIGISDEHEKIICDLLIKIDELEHENEELKEENYYL